MQSRRNIFRARQPNLTAMVDIVMCVLIFFMLGTVLRSSDLYLTVAKPVIDVPAKNNPHLGGEPVDVSAPIALHRMDGRTYAAAFGRQTGDLTGELGRFLAECSSQSSGDVQVVIQPDRDVPYQDVVTTYDQCRRANLQHVRIAAIF